MCWKHWNMVPRHLQWAVYRHYRKGQCDDKRPSAAWFDAAWDAIQAVWAKEWGVGLFKVIKVRRVRG